LEEITAGELQVAGTKSVHATDHPQSSTSCASNSPGDVVTFVPEPSFSFPQFARLPQEIKDLIWETAAIPPSPSVQAVGLLFDPPFGPIRLEVPSQKSMCLSAYYHALVEAGSACQDARLAFERAARHWEVQETAELAALMGDFDTTDLALIGAQRKRATIHLSNSCRDPTEDTAIEASKNHNIIKVWFNPQADLVLLDSVRGREKHFAWENLVDRLLHGGWSDHLTLAPIQHLAVEFSVSKFHKDCDKCDNMRAERKRFEAWCRAQRGEMVRDWRRGGDRPMPAELCVLCEALGDPRLADLSDEDKENARKWLRLKHTRELLSPHGYSHLQPEDVEDLDDTLKTLREKSEERSAEKAEVFDFDGFAALFPLLRRIQRVIDSIKASVPWIDPSQDYLYRGVYGDTIDACLRDFDDDELAWLKNAASRQYAVYEATYNPADRDPETDEPICHAGNPSDREANRGHWRDWCRNVEAIARFWPLITPHLQTQYIVDRGIKPKVGVSLPPGLRKFQGNGCVFVEVPPPKNRRLERGGEDEVWQYPMAGRWGENVFEVARRVGKLMRTRRRVLRHGITHGHLFPRPEPAYIQAAFGGELPDCRVLAVIEG
jgi:hypothetical protein